MTTVFADGGSLKSLMKCKNLVNIQNIVCFEKFTDEQKKYFD
jgi:hypothetical protein